MLNRRTWGGAGLQNLVVIVEDETGLRENLDFLFRAERVRTMTAADGMTGLSLVRKHRPKVLVLDMYLPHMSGFEVLDDIRSDPILENIFVIAVTGMADDSDDLREMQGKADVILGKPFDETQILELVRHAFEKEGDSSGLRRHLNEG